MVARPPLWALLGIGILLAALGGAWARPEIVFFYNFLVLSAAIVTFRLGPKATDLEASVDAPTMVTAGQTAEAFVTLRNRGRNSLTGRARAEAPEGIAAEGQERPIRLAPGEEVTWSVRLSPETRGDFAFRGVFVRAVCPLGLVSRDIEVETPRTIAVVPNPGSLRQLDVLSRNARLREAGQRRANRYGHEGEFESLREYVPGDDVRRLDHKAWGRSGKPMVRTYQDERNQAVILLLDSGRAMMAQVGRRTKLDYVLDCVLSIARTVTAAGDRIGVGVYAGELVRLVPPAKGSRHFNALLEAIRNVEAVPQSSDLSGMLTELGRHQSRRALLVVFTDYDDADEAMRIAEALRRLAWRHVILVVRVQDPRLEEAMAGVIRTNEDLYRHAAAAQLRQQKEAGDRVFRSLGIELLVSEPTELAQTVERHYRSIKARSKL
jgi:uncharacterized protein (DUF58 family)